MATLEAWIGRASAGASLAELFAVESFALQPWAAGDLRKLSALRMSQAGARESSAKYGQDLTREPGVFRVPAVVSR